MHSETSVTEKNGARSTETGLKGGAGAQAASGSVSIEVNPAVLLASTAAYAVAGGLMILLGGSLLQSPYIKVAVALVFLGFPLYVLLHDKRKARLKGSREAEFAETRQAGLPAGTNPAVSEKARTPVALSYTDKLTGLGNKLRIQEKFHNLVRQKAGADTVPGFALGLVNIDGMRPINDLYGTAGGDQLILQCSTRFRTALEGQGFIYRHDGDQFAFVLPESATVEDVQRIGRILQDVMHAPFDIEGSTVRLSGSFGFAVYPEAGDTFAALLTGAETALHHSKRKGRGRITVYSSEIEQAARENARLEQALRRAVSNDQISPHFQPIISLQDGQLLGFKSLARWIDPELGFVSPAKFIPLAEERGIISQLTDSLLMQAAVIAAEWPDDLFLSFNLSSAQLVDRSTAESILGILRRAGLPARRLEIEVTETAMMSDPETAAAIIEVLHDAGVRISMDDFGTGQSSLGRLRELKLDKVKIDRAFIMAIGEDKPAEHIVRAILEMCAGLDLTVVAEGIEEIGQAESLRRFGCHAGQGYLFGKPQDASKTQHYITEFRRQAQLSDRAMKVA